MKYQYRVVFFFIKELKEKSKKEAKKETKGGINSKKSCSLQIYINKKQKVN